MKKGNLVLIVLLLFIAGLFSACEKNDESKEKKYYDGTWICNSLHDNDSIVLTIKNNEVQVATSYQDTDKNAGYYQFRNGSQFVIDKDTLYFTEDLDNYEPWNGFSITKLSANSMELKYLGMLPAMPMYIGNYLFIRKLD